MRLPVAVMLLSAALLLAPEIVSPTAAFAQDPNAPCGWDANGYPLQCAQPPPGASIEAACMTTGRPENCVPYHQTACQVNGIQAACRLYALGRNCFGGDQNTCNYYVSLLRANTACALDRDQNACAWLHQQGY